MTIRMESLAGSHLGARRPLGLINQEKEGLGGTDWGSSSTGPAHGEMVTGGQLGPCPGRSGPGGSQELLSPPLLKALGSFLGVNQGGVPALSRGRSPSGIRKQSGEMTPAP